MEQVCKKLKVDTSLDHPTENSCNDTPSDNSSPGQSLPFQKFTPDQVLLTNPKSKLLAVLGKFPQSANDQAVIVAEKQPLTESHLESIFSENTQVTKSFQNDVYSQYVLNCLNGVGELKVMSIYPATDSHIKKYANQPVILVHESPKDYFSITKPFIKSHPFSLDVSCINIIKSTVTKLYRD